MTRTTVDNTQDVLDSRDIIERIEELESEQDELKELFEEAKAARKEPDTDDPELIASLNADIANSEMNLMRWNGKNWDELKALKKLAEEAEGYAPDWKHGETLIRESYFTEYCKELLEDIGDLPKGLPWYIAIDWEETADNLRIDYTEVEFDGVTYLIR